MLKDVPADAKSTSSSSSSSLSVGAGTHNTCAGCGISIKDRFYLVTADRVWHGACLRCCRCATPLDTQLSCFSRNGNIYCKEDYYRLFPSSRRCARCDTGISSTELVMRAKELVYHVGCFSCALCCAPLSAGDTAAIRGGRVFCGEHYDTDILRLESETIGNGDSGGCVTGGGGNVCGDNGNSNGNGNGNSGTLSVQFYPGEGSQKGRPRKRKPAAVLSHHHHVAVDVAADCQSGGGGGNGGLTGPGTGLGMGAGGGGGSSAGICSGSGTPLRMELLHGSIDLLSYDGSQSPGSSGSMTPQSRTKRMRTSFKHHQLRTMKSYFAINQNPDAKDLKQLAQKTGLSKRVLQVWFQNARAKWRRNVMRQDGQPQVASVSNLGSLTSAGGPPSVQSSASSNLDGAGNGHNIDDMHHLTFAELY